MHPKPGPLFLPQELAALVEDCWHADPEKRPEFTAVVETLGNVLKRMPAKKNSSGGCCSIS